MSEAPVLDKIIKNVRVVRPHQDAVELVDLGIKDGKFAQIAPYISPDETKEVFDAQNLLGFPGVVDAHMHIGIYQPLDQDAVTETKAAATGGVTTSLNYIRTGQYYLNKGGSYRDFFRKCWHYHKGIFLLIMVIILPQLARLISMRCKCYLRNMGLNHLKFLCSTVAMVCMVFPINKIYF